jgi:hypothetical protein
VASDAISSRALSESRVAKELGLTLTGRAPVVVARFALVSLMVLAGCSSARDVLPLSIETSALSLAEHQRLGSTEAAVPGIAAILTQGLGLPLPPRVNVFVYPGRLAFQHGLVVEAGLGEARAAELSNFAIGVGGRGQLLLNRGGLEGTEREWLRLIAHELTHVSQAELAGGEGRGEQWLAEGMAEWVAFSTLERLGLDTLAWRRRRALAGVLNHATLFRAGLALETHGTPQGFARWHLREGTLPTYQLAFLMADYLIERRGLASVEAYFRSFSDSMDRQRNFTRAFGITLAEFERDVLAHLTAPSAAAPAT